MIKIAASVLGLLFAACCIGACGPAAAVPAAQTSRIKTDDRATGAAFFSDDEFNAMQLRVVNLDDLSRYPTPAKLAPQVRVQILDSRTVELHGGANGQTSIPIIFERVRVLDGPAKDREGWISALTLE